MNKIEKAAVVVMNVAAVLGVAAIFFIWAIANSY